MVKNNDKNKSKRAHLINPRRILMDLGRILLLPCFALFQLKKYTVSGEKYKGFLRKGAILVCNHQSFSDPFVVGTCFWYRRMFFLAAEAVMRNKLLNFPLNEIGCVKIDRNISDIESIKKCVKLLKKGHTLSVFPQGSIQENNNLSSIKGGVILLAVQSGVPIIPLYTVRTKPYRPKQTIVIGEPFYCSDYCAKKFPSMKDIEFLSSTLLEKMNECKDTYEQLSK